MNYLLLSFPTYVFELRPYHSPLLFVKDIVASHFLLVVTGALPGWIPVAPTADNANVDLPGSNLYESSRSSTAQGAGVSAGYPPASTSVRPLRLIGSHSNDNSSRYVRTSRAMCGLRMAEIVEWLARRRVSKQSRASGSPRSSTAGTFSGLLGLVTVTSSSTSANGAYNNNKDVSEKDKASANKTAEQKNEDKIRRSRVTLCPLKLRLAYTLVDLGDVKQAAAYATDVKGTVSAATAELGEA